MLTEVMNRGYERGMKHKSKFILSLYDYNNITQAKIAFMLTPPPHTQKIQQEHLEYYCI